jgi:3'(2'),5'-bisphosphate nucleotidase
MAQNAIEDADDAANALARLAQAGVVQAMADLSVLAGGEILRIMQQGFETRLKPDASPVTVCDEAAEQIILDRLAARFPGIPIVAEEAAAKGFAPACGDLFFLVDPLDGTREFVNGKTDFTVNIALICKGAPVAGAVFAPATRTLWVGARIGGQERAATALVEPGGSAPAFAAMRAIRARPAPAKGLVALVSRSHSNPQVDAFLATLPIARRLEMGSSLKFCLIAEGEADVYPRMTPTMEWDTAAGDAVLRAAGGATRDEAGELLRYGKANEGFHNPNFIAWGATAG